MLSGLVRLVLTNAIYFKGQWLFQFEESATHHDAFHLLDGKTVDVPMMRQTETFLYAAGDAYQAVRLAYQVTPVSMLLLLPAKGRYEEIEESLSVDLVREIDDKSLYQSVNLTLPKFSFESTFSLNDALMTLGMADAFGEGADFSGMTGNRDLFISDVVHKAFVAVDEAGTEAAAATAVVMAESAMVKIEPVKMKVDRPFIFLINDDDSGAILFAGRVLNPDS
jgi:serpin B